MNFSLLSFLPICLHPPLLLYFFSLHSPLSLFLPTLHPVHYVNTSSPLSPLSLPQGSDGKGALVELFKERLDGQVADHVHTVSPPPLLLLVTAVNIRLPADWLFVNNKFLTGDKIPAHCPTRWDIHPCCGEEGTENKKECNREDINRGSTREVGVLYVIIIFIAHMYIYSRTSL